MGLPPEKIRVGLISANPRLRTGPHYPKGFQPQIEEIESDQDGAETQSRHQGQPSVTMESKLLNSC